MSVAELNKSALLKLIVNRGVTSVVPLVFRIMNVPELTLAPGPPTRVGGAVGGGNAMAPNGAGVGVGGKTLVVGVGVKLGIGVGLALAVGAGVGVGVKLGVAVGLGVGVDVRVGVGVGVGTAVICPLIDNPPMSPKPAFQFVIMLPLAMSTRKTSPVYASAVQ
jgi:hypothetical protein